MQHLTAAARFALLWDCLSDMLGTAATAVLLRRALKSAAQRRAVGPPVVIAREGLSYIWTVPESWQHAADHDALSDLRLLVEELTPLLVELTGLVVVRRLEQLPLYTSEIATGKETTV